MEKRFKFLKLYSEVEAGYEVNSIIAFNKFEYLMQYGKCIQYQKFIYINLWFVIITLKWLTKIK